MGSSESSPEVHDVVFKRVQNVTGPELRQNPREGPVPQRTEYIGPKTKKYESLMQSAIPAGTLDHEMRTDDHSKTPISPLCPTMVTSIDCKFLLSIGKLLRCTDGNYPIDGLTRKELLTMSISGVEGKNFTLKISLYGVEEPLLKIIAPASDKTELHPSRMPPMEIYDAEEKRYGSLKVNDCNSVSLKVGNRSHRSSLMQIAVVNVANLEVRLFDSFGDVVGEAYRMSDKRRMHCCHIYRNNDIILLLGCFVASMLRLYHVDQELEGIPKWIEDLEETLEDTIENLQGALEAFPFIKSEKESPGGDSGGDTTVLSALNT